MASYQNYDPSVDYADRLRRMMASGASAAEVEDMLRRRVSKAETLPGHEQYAYDADYAAARNYIDQQNQYRSAQSGGTGAGWAAPYAGRLEQALGRLEAQTPFSYDPEDDPAYQAYRAAYRREGDRAGRNTLAEAAALTGGQASTAAVAAASQARDYYNSKAGDVVPDLYKLAWQMHQGAQQNLVDEIETLAGLSAAAYGREADRQALDYKRFADSRDFSDQQYQDVRAREDKAAAEEADSAYQDSRLNQSAEQQAYTRAMAFLNAGVMPTDRMLNAAGIDRATAQSMRAAALRRLNK